MQERCGPVDPLFRSAALAYGPAVVAAVLTGQLDDGTAGLIAVKDRGGTTVVQDPREATAAAMPNSALRHSKIDFRCTLKEMASLFVLLASDDPPAVRVIDVDRLMEIEDRIAEGIFTVEDWRNLEHMSTPSGFNCPDCRSALYELKDSRVLRFRCRSGHAYSAQSLLSGEADARERDFSSTFGALIEEATLARRLHQLDRDAESPPVRSLEDRARALEGEAAQVCTWLHEMAGLVEPEPSAELDGNEAATGT